ncbi:MAG: hypothetical protein ACREF3_15385 [Acetobacteraceae bacterium]
MSGFVDNYVRQPGDTRKYPRAVMHCFTPESAGDQRARTPLRRLRPLVQLSTMPGQTWPNRLFAHSSTAVGRMNNDTIPLPFFCPSSCRLSSAGWSDTIGAGGSFPLASV